MEKPTFNLIDKQGAHQSRSPCAEAIAHPCGLKILCVVGDQEACRQEIVDAVGRPRATSPSTWPSCGKRGGVLTRPQGCQPGLLPRRRFPHLQLIGMMRAGLLRRPGQLNRTMDFINQNILLVAVVVTSGLGLSGPCSSRAAALPSIPARRRSSSIAKTPTWSMSARPAEFAAGHLPKVPEFRRQARRPGERNRKNTKGTNR